MKKTETIERSQLERHHLSSHLVTLISYHYYMIYLTQNHHSPLQISLHFEELLGQTW